MQHVACIALLALVSAAGHAQQPTVRQSVVDKGAYLTAASGCVSCHTDNENDGVAFAGGHALETPFGIFYTPNITPDIETGIGGWTDEQFLAALRDGLAPDGRHYYPAFPYPSYAGVTDSDALAIKAYLDTLTPVTQPNRANELHWYMPGRWAMGIWKALFSPWPYSPPAANARGAYLVRHLGHCGECHTPRNPLGALRLSNALTGSPKDTAGGGAPAIDSASLRTANWSLSDLEFFLELGMLPDGDFVGGSMTAVVDDNTAKLTAADRRAIAEYLLGIVDQ